MTKRFFISGLFEAFDLRILRIEFFMAIVGWIYKKTLKYHQKPTKISKSKNIDIPSKPTKSKTKTSHRIYNTSSIKLCESETSLLNEGLNYCLTMKEPIKG